MVDILKQINQEIKDYENKDTQIVPGLYFNQKEIIELAHFYYNSKFKTGEIDDEGNRKYFFNIVKNPCKVFSKSIDFDTKNIRLLTTGSGNPLKTWFLERGLKFWMRDKQFGLILNRIFKELPIFGSVVLKAINGTLYFVDLRNFILEKGADDLSQSNFLIEIHNFTPASFRKRAKEMKWDKDKVDKVINLFHEQKDTSHIRLYERYGEIENESGEYEYRRIFWADVGEDEYDQYGDIEAEHPGVELESKKWEGNPYWEFHAEKVPGRWLGVGVVETLVEPQIRQNEIANLQSKGSYWNAIRLFFTRDPNLAGNLSSDKVNGEVLTGDDPITEINTTDRNLAFFNQEYVKWQGNRDELSFSYDAVQGERSPAGTPLGSVEISIGQTLSYFEGIQENIALKVKEMLYEVIIPQFHKENNKEHTLRIVGDDLDTYIGMVSNELVAKEMVRLMTKGKFPNEEDAKITKFAIEESIRQGKEKLLTVPKGAYENAKYDIDIDITGESIDTRVRNATMFSLLQAITADPGMLKDPTKRKFLFRMAEDGGVNPYDLFGTEKTKIEETLPEEHLRTSEKRSGGGVSAPALQNNIPGQNQKTI